MRKTIDFVCIECKKVFQCFPCRKKDRKFCSEKCYRNSDSYKRNPRMKGKKHSLDTRFKMSESRKGKNLGMNNPCWKGGIIKHNGYTLFKIKGKYIQEHRIIVENFIGRTLQNEECTHHINGERSDNRIENLMVFKNQSSHKKFHGNPENVKTEEIIFDGRFIHAETP